MTDELVSALIPGSEVRVVIATTAQLSQHARSLHQAELASAVLLGFGLTGAALLASLQKEHSRVSLQLECDGPLRGFFTEGDAEGRLRGYLKNPKVDFVGAEGTYHWRAALGNKGYLSVLRDFGEGEFYRSSVDLAAFDVPKDLERYFQSSDQVDSRLRIASASGADPLAAVCGVLLQLLPSGDRAALDRLAARLDGEGGLSAALSGAPVSATALLATLFAGEPFEVMARYPLRYACRCSRERVERALVSMGKAALTEVIVEDHKADVSCEFCGSRYLFSEADLRVLLEQA